jgi:hypothetical protein
MNYYGIYESGFAMRLGKHKCPADAERAAMKKFGASIITIISEQQAKVLLGSLVTKMRMEQKHSA